MMRGIAKARGPWTTDNGRRADAWPVQTLPAPSGLGLRTGDVIVGRAAHPLATAGGGLAAVWQVGPSGGGGSTGRLL